MDFKISNIIKEDLEEIYTLGCGEKDFSADGGKNIFWPKETLLSLFESTDDITLKLVVNGEIVGFSFVMIHKATKKAYLENFYILNEYRYLENEFYLEVEKEIKSTDAQFIAYFYDEQDDCNDKNLFLKNDYFPGNSHIWLHKNISFSNPSNK
jgi:hypothetical protein